jgi:hypothetical protein
VITCTTGGGGGGGCFFLQPLAASSATKEQIKGAAKFFKLAPSFFVQEKCQVLMKNGAPGAIRTRDPRFRRPMLYPTELRAHTNADFIHLRPEFCILN